MGKNASPMKVFFTKEWHEACCPQTKAVRDYHAFWMKNADRLPSAFKNAGLGWHDMELRSVKFTDTYGGREDMQLEMFYSSPTSSFSDKLVFKNAELRKYNVNVGDVWLYDEVELLPEGRYFIRIMFYAGGEKRHYIKVVCDDVVSLQE